MAAAIVLEVALAALVMLAPGTARVTLVPGRGLVAAPVAVVAEALAEAFASLRRAGAVR